MNEKPGIHLINPMWNAAGGSEWRTLELYRLLREDADCHIWSDQEVATSFKERVPVRQLGTESAAQMSGDTVVLVGSYFPLDQWIQAIKPSRLIVIHNVFDPRLLQRTLQALNKAGHSRTEIVYASQLVATASGIPGIIQTSLIDMGRFRPRYGYESTRRDTDWTVGRLSRDIALKHHPDDADVYAKLLKENCNVALMGARSINASLPQSPKLRVLDTNSIPAEQFLQSLDVFYFRTGPSLIEACGRVVIEAMACATPVVAYRAGGYCEFLVHGENALLFSSNEEALEMIFQLRTDEKLRTRITDAALATARDLNSDAKRERLKHYYLQTQAHPRRSATMPTWSP